MKQLVSALFILILTSPLFAEPDVGVTLKTSALGYPYTLPFTLTVIFTEPVTGFDLQTINLVNASVSNLAGNCNTKFTMLVTPTFPGPMSLFVPAKSVRSLITGSFNKISNKLNIMALDPVLHPSSNFDLSLWTLTLPTPLGDVGGAISISSNTLNGHPELNSGYTDPPYFFTDEKTGAMDFFAPLNGATTPNAVFPRSELSEFLPHVPHAWKLNTYASNSLEASLLVTQMPPSKKIVIGKIRDKGTPDNSGIITASKTLVKIYYDLNQLSDTGEACNGCIYARIRPTPAQDTFLKTRPLVTNVPLNRLFIYKITLSSDGTLKVNVHFLNDAAMNDPSFTYNLNTSTDNTVGWGTQELFFKAGVYVQDNGISNFDGGAASFYSLKITHTN